MLGVNYDKSAARRTRQELADKVRNDWEEVLAQRLRGSNDKIVHEDEDHIDEDDDLTHPPTNATDWLERTYASSDPSSGEHTEDDEPTTFSTSPASPTHRTSTNTKRPLHTHRAFLGHHCMFPDGSDGDGNSSAGTDSSGKPVTDEVRKRQERKRRRRRRLEAEMAWNEGLRNWEQTRDIWCRAREVPTSSLMNATASASTASDLASSPETMTSAATSLDQDTLDDEDLKRAVDDVHITDQVVGASRLKKNVPRTTLMPVSPPLIPPTDPGRQNLPAQYSMIYSKVVTEGLRPQVPINLSHMIPALVKGWKDNDEWPPKSTAPAPTKTLTVKGKSQINGEWWSQRQKDKVGHFEGLKEGGRRLFGLSSSPTDSGDKTGSKSKKKAKSKASSPKDGKKVVTVTESKVPSSSQQASSSPRASTENEKENPNKVKKSVAKVGRRIKESMTGGSGEIITAEDKN